MLDRHRCWDRRPRRTQAQFRQEGQRHDSALASIIDHLRMIQHRNNTTKNVKTTNMASIVERNFHSIYSSHIQTPWTGDSEILDDDSCRSGAATVKWSNVPSRVSGKYRKISDSNVADLGKIGRLLSIIFLWNHFLVEHFWKSRCIHSIAH
jgi:hypothetical protein